MIDKNMKLLKKLTNAGEVKIHIPEMVKNEYISRRIDEAQDYLDKSRKNINKVKNKIYNNNDVHNDLENLIDLLKNNSEKLEETIAKDFKSLEKELDVNILKFPMSFPIRNILDDYFSGGGVFKTKKSRDDIPDAIINLSIKDLLKEKKEISIIIKDGVFREYLKKNNSIFTYESIIDFLNLDKIKEISNHLESGNLEKQHIVYISTEKFTKSLVSSFTNIKMLYFYDDKIKNKEVSAIKGDDIEVSYSLSSNIKKASISNVEVLSKNTYSLLLNIEDSANIDYSDMPYYQYCYVKKMTNRELYITSDDKNGIYSVSEFVAIKATIAVTITLSQDLSLDAFIKECSNIGNKNSIITVTTEEYLVEIL